MIKFLAPSLLLLLLLHLLSLSHLRLGSSHLDVQQDLNDWRLLPGTLVATSVGLIPIERIQLGTQVWSFDMVNEQLTLASVINSFIRSSISSDLYDCFSMNSSGGTRVQLHSRQPIWSINDKWIYPSEILKDEVSTTSIQPKLFRWTNISSSIIYSEAFSSSEYRWESTFLSSVGSAPVRDESEMVLHEITVADHHNYFISTSRRKSDVDTGDDINQIEEFLLIHNSGSDDDDDEDFCDSSSSEESSSEFELPSKVSRSHWPKWVLDDLYKRDKVDHPQGSAGRWVRNPLYGKGSKVNAEFLDLDEKEPVGRRKIRKSVVQIDHEPAQYSDLKKAANGDEETLRSRNLRYLHKLDNEGRPAASNSKKRAEEMIKEIRAAKRKRCSSSSSSRTPRRNARNAKKQRVK